MLERKDGSKVVSANALNLLNHMLGGETFSESSGPT